MSILLDTIFGAITLGAMEVENAISGVSTGGGTTYDSDDFVSESGDIFYPDEVKKELDRLYRDVYNPRNMDMYHDLKSHGIRGWWIASHVCAYLSGKEGLHNEKWNKKCKIAANILCKEFGVPEMYKGIGTNNKTIKDYGINSDIIILNSTINKAMRKFPCEGFIKSIKEKEEKKNKEREVPPVLLIPTEVITVDDETIKLDGDDKEENSIEQPKPVPLEDPFNQIEQIAKLTIEGAFKSIINDIIDKATSEMMKKYASPNPDPVKQTKEESDKVTSEMMKKYASPNPDLVKPTKEESDITLEQGNKDESKSTLKSPIFKFGSNTTPIDQKSISNDVPNSQVKKFNDTFGQYLKDKKYTLKKILGGVLECDVQYEEDNIVVSHIIDPGLAVGDEYYVIAPTVGGPFETIMVHPSEVEILNKVFNSKIEKYRLTPEEHQKALSHIFLNQRIYNVFDMSSMGSHLRKLKTDPNKFKKFGQKLTFIINCIDNSPMLGRLRFAKYNSIDNFEVRSDNDKKHKTKSPLPGQTLEYLSGVVIQVSNDDILILFQGQSIKYHIDKYDIM